MFSETTTFTNLRLFKEELIGNLCKIDAINHEYCEEKINTKK